MVKYGDKNPYCEICQIYKHGNCEGKDPECEALDLTDIDLKSPEFKNPALQMFLQMGKNTGILIKKGEYACVTLKDVEKYKEFEKLREDIGLKPMIGNILDLIEAAEKIEEYKRKLH